MGSESPGRQYARWQKTSKIAIRHGWKNIEGWVFESPSGTRHDLSAADLKKLDVIEREGQFLVKKR